ncbi:BglG family transcription antiterminator [Companilactobacillus alimentarius]|uniref:BglG family transcription antiterminator n=1 Tax=Companilactobacillus alimentarius TaxID=1602 RepID=UPI0028B752ED|nr:PTS sugar transporter subunit IIA [Companilactobacillus alimentarius]MDT6952541.1 PTS sugar transporter subunit IIA [Companilactobacillus alimentarius]
MLKLSYPRLKKILMIIILARVEISGSELAKRLNVSTRTIRSDINELNSDIGGYDLKILNRRGKGYYLNFKNEKKLTELKKDLKSLDRQASLDTVENRIKYLLNELLISNQSISIDDILDNLYISINTFNNYILEIKRIVDKYNLNLVNKHNRILLVGDEESKRYCFIDQLENKNYKEYILGFTSNERKLFSNINLDSISKLVNNFVDLEMKEIPDYNRKNIVIHVALSLSRIKLGHVLTKFSSELQLSSSVQDDFNKLFNDLEKDEKIKIPLPEREYIKYHIGLNNPQIVKNTNEPQSQLIKKSVILFLDKIRDNYTFNLLNDKLLIDNLTEHIKAVIKINDLDSTRKNPLLDVILSTFPLAYEMTVTSINILEHQLKLRLSKDELSFITLHVGASMERNYNNKWKKRNVAIICGSGTATANLLKIKLEGRFSNYLNIMGVYSYAEYCNSSYPKDVDFLISTVPILNSSVPVVEVDLSNYANDSKELYDFITSTSDDQQVLYSLFKPELVFVNSELSNRKQVLNFLCDNLEKQKVVKQDFREKMFKREGMYSTAIGGGIAIPHPIKFAANKSNVAFLQLKHPITWDDKGNKIQLVFLLAINKDEYPKIQTLFSFLVDLQNDSRFYNAISKCNNSNEAIKVINSFIQNNLTSI